MNKRVNLYKFNEEIDEFTSENSKIFSVGDEKIDNQKIEELFNELYNSDNDNTFGYFVLTISTVYGDIKSFYFIKTNTSGKVYKIINIKPDVRFV